MLNNMFQSFLNIFVESPELRNKVLVHAFPFGFGCWGFIRIGCFGCRGMLPGVDQAKCKRGLNSSSRTAKLRQQRGGANCQLCFAVFGRVAWAEHGVWAGGDAVYFGFDYFSVAGDGGSFAGEDAERRGIGAEEDPGVDAIRDGATLHAAGDHVAELHAAWAICKYQLLPSARSSFWFSSGVMLTAGCIFLMWLGEQIDEYGLGNGVSLIILAGIVSRMPHAVNLLIAQTNWHNIPDPSKNRSRLGKSAHWRHFLCSSSWDRF